MFDKFILKIETEYTTSQTPHRRKATWSEKAMNDLRDHCNLDAEWSLMDLIGNEIVKENEINVPRSFEQIHWGVANKGYWDSGNGPYLNTTFHNLETIEWNEVVDFQDLGLHNKEESHKPDKVNWQKEGF